MTITRLCVGAIVLVLGMAAVQGVESDGGTYIGDTYIMDRGSLSDLKEFAGFAAWPGRSGGVRPATVLSMESIPGLEGATELKKHSGPSAVAISRDGVARSAQAYRYRWELASGDRIEVEMVVGECAEDVHEYLINWYYSCCNIGHIVPGRDDPAVAGDISFEEGTAFLRDNVLILFRRGMGREIAAGIDELLLAGPVYPSATDLATWATVKARLSSPELSHFAP